MILYRKIKSWTAENLEEIVFPVGFYRMMYSNIFSL